MRRRSFQLAFRLILGIGFGSPAVAGGILPDTVNQVIIEGRFAEATPAFLVVFSSQPLRDESGRLRSAVSADAIAKVGRASEYVGIRLYGKPATQPGRFDYFFGTQNDGDQPWNDGTDFAWQDWQTLAADVWDNVSIVALPPNARSNRGPSGVITDVTIRRGGKLLYDSRAKQSYPNKRPIDASLKPFSISPQRGRFPLLNLAERMERFRNDYYELAECAILKCAYGDLGQTEKNKYANRGKNWCSESIWRLVIWPVAQKRRFQFQQSLSFDVIVTERLGAFVSWDMLADHGSWNDTSRHMAGGGLSFLLTKRLAISWRSAVGLNAAAPDFLNDIRFAYRF